MKSENTFISKSYNTIVVLLLFSSLISCQKYKKPTDVSFYVDINTTASTPNIEFTQGFIVLSYFEFDGEREKGDDVYFEKDFNDGLLINFNQFGQIPELNFQIPQGIYERLDIRLRTSDDLDIVSLCVDGVYTSLSMGEVPIKIEFEDPLSFDARAKDSDDEKIILEEAVSSNALVLFDPNYWTSPVSTSLFESADQTDIDGVNTILIRKDSNEDIYNIIVDRIDDAIHVEFN